MARQPVQGACQEGAGVVLVLAGQDLGVGQSGGVIDADMQEVPARAVIAAAFALSSDAMPGPGEPPQLLDIQMDKLAWCGAFERLQMIGEGRLRRPSRTGGWSKR